jgi:hypothetical protein
MSWQTEAALEEERRSAAEIVDAQGAGSLLDEPAAVPQFAQAVDSIATWSSPPPGFCSEFVEHCLATAHRKQPELALIGSLATLATLCGRKVRDEYDTRCNIYFIGLAGTGSGKEHPRQISKRLFLAVGRESAFCESFGSAQSIPARLNDEPDQLALIDEFGRYLATQTGKRADAYLAQIPTVLMRLYTSSNSVYVSDLKADTKNHPAVTVVAPNLNLSATTTPGHFYGALSSSSVLDGYLNRMLVIEASDDLPRLQTTTFQELPRSLVESARCWSDSIPGDGQRPVLKVSQFADGAASRLCEYSEHCDDVARGSDEAVRSLFVRAAEKARKLALLYACSESPMPEVSLAGAEWAIGFAEHATRFLIEAVADYVADTPFQRSVKKVRRFIHGAGSGGLLKSKVTKRMSRDMKAHEVREILDHLIESGDIRQFEKTKGGGRTGTWFVDTRHAS